MATPQYEFVSDSPLMPILQGANTALGGITLERAAARKQQERLRTMAQVLGQQGFTADAAIYEQMALSESPDYATAALTGKATTRDLALPFEHALKVIESQRNRDTSLEVAGVRSGTGTLSRAAMNARDEQISRRVAILDRNKRDLENEVQRYERDILAAKDAGNVGRVEELSAERDKVAEQAKDLQVQIEELLQQGEANVENTFGGGTAAGGGTANAGGMVGTGPDSSAILSPTGALEDTPLKDDGTAGAGFVNLTGGGESIPTGRPAGVRGGPEMAASFAGKPVSFVPDPKPVTNVDPQVAANAFAGKESSVPSGSMMAAASERTLLPFIPGKATNSTDAGSLLNRPRPAADTTRARNANVGPDTPIPPKTPEIAVTEKPAATEKSNEQLAKENKLDYELPYATPPDPTASRVAKDKFTAGKNFASMKQLLYIQYGWSKELDEANTPAELKLVKDRLGKLKDQYGSDSPEAAQAAGERARGVMADKDLYSTVNKFNPSTGKYHYSQQKKGSGGIKSVGPNYYISESTGDGFYVDQTGHMVRVTKDGKHQPMMSKDNKNVHMTKAEFENALITGGASEISELFPTKIIDPNTLKGQKDMNKGLIPAKRNSILDKFEQTQQNATQNATQ